LKLILLGKKATERDSIRQHDKKLTGGGGFHTLDHGIAAYCHGKVAS